MIHKTCDKLQKNWILDQTGLEISVISPEVFPSFGPDVKHEFSNHLRIRLGPDQFGLTLNKGVEK